MPRPSPQTDRLRWIIGLLASAPRDSFSLAQIARHLDVSKATCLPMVAALTSSGWLVRDPRTKAYRLGPALIEIGRAAEQASPAEALVPALVALCEEAGAGAIVWQTSGDDLVLSEIVGRTGPRPEWSGMKRGHRIRLAAPLGAVHVAWSDAETVERWLASSGAPDPEEARARLVPGLAAVARRGYAIELQDHMQHELFQLIQRLRAGGPTPVDDLIATISRRADERMAELEYLVDDIDPDATYEPVSINAAVFDRYGSAGLLVCLVDFPPTVPGSEVLRLGALVRDRCRDLTVSNRGRLPAGWPDPT